MAQASEYPCGCIVHPTAGPIRFCAGTVSKTLSGKKKSRDESAEKAHNEAMKAKKHRIRQYPVADGVLP